jgi:hypothetical protein
MPPPDPENPDSNHKEIEETAMAEITDPENTLAAGNHPGHGNDRDAP